MAADAQDNGSNTITYIIIGFALLLSGVGVWIMWPEIKKRMSGTQIGTSAGDAIPDAPATSSSDLADKIKNAVDNVVETVKTTTGSTSSGTWSQPSSASSVFPLSKSRSSRGKEVENLQRYLNLTFNAGLVEDGIYGSKTQAAVQRYMSISSGTISQSDYDYIAQRLKQIDKAQETALTENSKYGSVPQSPDYGS